MTTLPPLNDALPGRSRPSWEAGIAPKTSEAATVIALPRPSRLFGFGRKNGAAAVIAELLLQAERQAGRLVAMMICGVWTGATPTAGAGEMQSVSQYDQYQTLSKDPMFKWAGAVTVRSAAGVEATASCVAVAPTVVIGAAHFTPGPTSTTMVSTVTFGRNFKAGERLIMEVDRWERYPEYVSGNQSTIDLGIYHLKQPLQNFTPVTFADAPLGTNPVMVDFGMYGDTITGPLASIGDRFAGRAAVSDTIGAGSAYPGSKYAFLAFGGPGPNRTTALDFASGAPWYDGAGNLVFLTIAKNNSMSRYTISLRLTLPEVQAWLQPRMAASWAAVPADYGDPPQLACTTGEGGLTVRWDEKAIGCLLERSVDLTVLERVDRGGGATTIYGPGTYDDVAAGRRRFYRLAKP